MGSDQEQETADETQEILSGSGDLSYETPQSLTRQQFSQPELNDLVRDLGLSKNAAEVLASRLQENNELSHTTKVSYFWNWEQAFVPFFTEENKFVYCHNISGLLQELGMPVYHPNDWQYTVIQMLTVIQLLLNYLLETVKVSKQIMMWFK